MAFFLLNIGVTSLATRYLRIAVFLPVRYMQTLLPPSLRQIAGDAWTSLNKLVPGKTYLFREEVDYLGFRVGKDGIKMKEDYVAKIVEWTSPKSTKELWSLLGFMGYYRSFIRGYAKLTNEMNGIRSAKKFEGQM